MVGWGLGGALFRGAGYAAGRLAATGLYNRYFGRRRGYPRVRRGSYISRGYGGAAKAGKARTRGVYGRASNKYDANMKFTDLVQSVSVDSSAAPELLNGITAGTGIAERIGNRIRMNKVVWNMRFWPEGDIQDPDGNAQAGPIRFLLFYDKQANGSSPALTDLLSAARTTSNINEDNRQRFIILYDKIINQPVVTCINQAGASDNNILSWTNKMHRCTIPIGLMTQYNDVGGNIADITSGSLYYVLYNDVGFVVGHNMKCHIDARLYYHG